MKASLVPAKTLSALLAAGGLFAIATPASAVVINTAADTFISGDNQSTNYGSFTNLNALEGGTAYAKDRYVFIRFDLSAYTGGTIAGAELTLIPQDISATPQDFDVFGIPDGGPAENFDESTLTWANSGYAFTGSAIDTSGLTLVGSFTGIAPADEGVPQTLSSTALDTFLNTDANNIASFLIVSTNGTGFFNKFDSKEAVSGGSTLTVTASTIPEPGASALLAALGVLATATLARRRRG